MHRRDLCVGLLSAAALASCGRRPRQLPGAPVRILLNPSQIAYLPVYLAYDRGYFRDEGLDVRLKSYAGSANAQLPLLARGDVDVGGVIAAPALFNQATDGFGIKLVTALTSPAAGHVDGVSLMMREDVSRSGAVRTLSQLRGRAIDASAEGNPIDLLIRFALREGGLGAEDVKLSYKIRTPSDVLYLFQERQVELAGVSEPTATLIAGRGLARKWLGYRDVIPWYQDTFLGCSQDFLRDRPETVARLTLACHRAAQALNASGGAWTSDVLTVAAKWSGFKPADLHAMGGLPYWSPDGAIDLSALDKVQKYWVHRGFVESPSDLHSLLEAPHVISA